jgi:SAM-dependent methyltransferase
MTIYNDAFKDLDAGCVLDVATGAGAFLDELLKDVKSYTEAVGIDKKETLADAFSKTFKDNERVRFQPMDAVRLDFADASFDTVCISYSLHHLEQPEITLGEMKRVLKPGGTFIINEMYPNGNQAETQMTHTLLHHWFARIDTVNNVYHRETYTREQIIALFGGLGLHDLQYFDFSDLSDDPKSSEVGDELFPIIDRYIERANGHPELQEAGEKIRERIKEIGFHSATTLLLVARK